MTVATTQLPMPRFELMKYTALGTIAKNVKWQERGPIVDRSTSDSNIESDGYEVHEKMLAASRRQRERRPETMGYGDRVGYDAAYRIWEIMV